MPAVAHPVRDHCLADRSIDSPIAPAGGRLWLYVLREADVRGGGERLGEVGRRLVAEVLLGLLDADPESHRVLDPNWEPTLPAAAERFGVLDLLVGPA